MKLTDSKAFLVRKMARQDLNQVALMQVGMIPGSTVDKVLLSLTNELTHKSYLYLVICKRITTKNDANESRPHNLFRIFVNILEPRVAESFIRKYLREVLTFFDKKHASGEILGFVGLWFGYNEVHINSIYVKDSNRRTGLGELLQIAAMQVAINSGSDRLTLEVRISNLIAQALYRKYGFIEEGIRHKYYRDNNENALIMTNANIQSSEYEDIFRSCIRQYELRWEDHLGGKVISLLNI